MFSGGAMVNCTGPAAGTPSPAPRKAMSAATTSAMVATAVISHAIRFDRAGGATAGATALSLEPEATPGAIAT